MFKETKARGILKLLGKNPSAREVPKVLGVFRNTVAETQALFLQPGRSWDDISGWGGGRPYGLFYRKPVAPKEDNICLPLPPSFFSKSLFYPYTPLAEYLHL